MSHTYYSIRTGKNDNQKGLPLKLIADVFMRTYNLLCDEGYFDENFGSYCVDMGDISGKVADIDLEILLKIRKQNLWPLQDKIATYSEEDFFDIIEFLHLNISKPIDGSMHNYNDCGMHWETFSKKEGQALFRKKVNEVLGLYEKPFELSERGEILHKPEKGFEPIFKADIPSKDKNITSRINSAITQYRRHAATLDDRRQSVRDLADVLEYLRPKVSNLLTKKDEKDLFNLANNFGIRHHNDKQKNDYDLALWLSWMFYYYLATIHVLLRKLSNVKI